MIVNSAASNMGKFHALFPFIGGAFTLGVWFSTKHLLVLFFLVVFLWLFIYTLFFSKYELYIDTSSRKVIKKIHWLFVNSKTEMHLKDYKGIYVSSGYKRGYTVVLVHKHATNNASGTNIIENIPLKLFSKGEFAAAKQAAIEFGDILGVDVVI